MSSISSLSFSRTKKNSGTSDLVLTDLTLQQKKQAVSVKEVYTCPMHPEIISDKPGKCPKCKMNLVKKEIAGVIYTCPMHPEVIKDKPGKCPKCKMNLVGKEPAKKMESSKKKS
jgi:hypothetical protein